MIYLYTAPPGTGKTCWVVKQLVDNWIPDPKNENRIIYSNIAGLKIEGIKSLPDDGDFRKCEDGSIIIIDEPQDIDHYNSDSRGVNPVAKALSKHRHRGFDIHFITQDPSLLHKYVLKNVYLHYYLWRPAQRKSIEIYTFARAIVTPTALDFKNAYDKIWWRFEKEYLKYYKSTVLNTSEPKISTKKLSVIITGIIFLLMIGAGMFPAIRNSLQSKNDEKQQVTEVKNEKEANNSYQQQQQQQEQQQIQMNYQNQLEQQKEQQKQIDELHKKYLDDYTVEVADDDVIRPASVVAIGNRCQAYNKYGDKLNIEQSKCFSMLKNGTIPKPRNNNNNKNNNNIDLQAYTQANQMQIAE